MKEIQQADIELLNKKCLQLEERINQLECENKQVFVTPKELSEILRCSLNNVYIKIREGKIIAVPIGRSYRIPMEQFTTYTKEKQLKNRIFQ